VPAGLEPATPGLEDRNPLIAGLSRQRSPRRRPSRSRAHRCVCVNRLRRALHARRDEVRAADVGLALTRRHVRPGRLCGESRHQRSRRTRDRSQTSRDVGGSHCRGNDGRVLGRRDPRRRKPLSGPCDGRQANCRCGNGRHSNESPPRGCSCDKMTQHGQIIGVRAIRADRRGNPRSATHGRTRRNRAGISGHHAERTWQTSGERRQ
jgi:hypothetical protein